MTKFKKNEHFNKVGETKRDWNRCPFDGENAEDFFFRVNVYVFLLRFEKIQFDQ